MKCEVMKIYSHKSWTAKAIEYRSLFFKARLSLFSKALVFLAVCAWHDQKFRSRLLSIFPLS